MKISFEPKSDGIRVELDLPEDLIMRTHEIAGYCRDAVVAYDMRRAAAEYRDKETLRFNDSVKFDF